MYDVKYGTLPSEYFVTPTISTRAGSMHELDRDHGTERQEPFGQGAARRREKPHEGYMPTAESSQEDDPWPKWVSSQRVAALRLAFAARATEPLLRRSIFRRLERALAIADSSLEPGGIGHNSLSLLIQSVEDDVQGAQLNDI